MIEIFKIIHNYYDTGAAVKLNFNLVDSTRGTQTHTHTRLTRLTALCPGLPR